MFSQIICFLTISQIYTTATSMNSTCQDVQNHKNYHLVPHGAECRPLLSSPRIMGGENAELGEFPWMVQILLYLASRDLKVMWCTGSIINSKYIITAAHCMPDDIIQLYEMLVRVGELDLMTQRDCDDTDCAPPPVTYQVDKYIPHPEYNKNTTVNDLGLIRVKGTIHWSDYVFPACLPMTCYLMEKSFEGENLVLSGFGALIDSPETQLSAGLQKVTLIGTVPDVCALTYSRPIVASQICVGGSDVGGLNKDACHGDSGGPLLYHSHRTAPSTPYLVGLVSSGENCTVSRTWQAPGVYTRVASHLLWILDTIQE